MRDELAMAYKEGQWAWSHGEPLDACPYDTELHGHHAIRWCLGWTELDELNRQLDLTSELAGNPS